MAPVQAEISNDDVSISSAIMPVPNWSYDDSDILDWTPQVLVENQYTLPASARTITMEICGGVSSLDEFGLIRHHRDLFVCRVGEGSNFALKGFAARPLMPDITLQ